jgi:hypothetical protein
MTSCSNSDNRIIMVFGCVFQSSKILTFSVVCCFFSISQSVEKPGYHALKMTGVLLQNHHVLLVFFFFGASLIFISLFRFFFHLLFSLVRPNTSKIMTRVFIDALQLHSTLFVIAASLLRLFLFYCLKFLSN